MPVRSSLEKVGWTGCRSDETALVEQVPSIVFEPDSRRFIGVIREWFAVGVPHVERPNSRPIQPVARGQQLSAVLLTLGEHVQYSVVRNDADILNLMLRTERVRGMRLSRYAIIKGRSTDEEQESASGSPRFGRAIPPDVDAPVLEANTPCGGLGTSLLLFTYLVWADVLSSSLLILWGRFGGWNGGLCGRDRSWF